MTTDTVETTEQIQEQTALPPGDADSPPLADAAAEQITPPDAALETETTAAVEEYVTAKKGKGSKKREPEAETRQQPVIDRAAIDQALNTFRTNHSQRQASLDGLKGRLTSAGLSEIEADYFVKEAKDNLNSHHADALRYADAEGLQIGQALANDAWTQDVTEGLKALGPA